MENVNAEKCKLIADVTLINNNHVLMVKYKDNNKYDHQKGWFLPDDVLNFAEHPGEGARRIVKEQLNIIISDELNLHHLESFIGRDGSWHLVFHYLLFSVSASEVKPSDEIASAEWFNINDLPEIKDVAHYGWALNTVKKIINNKTAF